MKRLLMALLLTLFLTTGAWAGEWMKQSAQQTADAAITASAGVLHGIIVITDATNAVTLNMYDNATAASGTKLIPTSTITTGDTDRIQSISLYPPVRFYNGIYVNITCSGTVSYMVYFESE